MSQYRSDPLALRPGLIEGPPKELVALAAEPAFCDQLGSLRVRIGL